MSGKRGADLSSETLVPVNDEEAMRGFLLQALRANTEAMGRIAGRTDRQDEKLDKIGEAIHSIDKRLSVIENNTIERDVKRNSDKIDILDARMTKLEAMEHKRQGAMGLWDWARKSWPILAGVSGIAYLLIERGPAVH